MPDDSLPAVDPGDFDTEYVDAQEARIGYDRALIRGHKPFVVAVEIRLAGKSALQAEATILHMLEWVKENYPADFNLDEWQSTGVEDEFSQVARAYRADEEIRPDPMAARPCPACGETHGLPEAPAGHPVDCDCGAYLECQPGA